MKGSISFMYTIPITISITIMITFTLNLGYAQNEIKIEDTLEVEENKVELLNYEIIDDKFSTRLVGKVQNLLDNTAEFVKISATFYDENGDRIASNYFTYAEPSDLEPNIQAPFEMYVDDDVVNQAQNYAVTITWNEQGDLQLHSNVYESLNQTQQQ